MRPRDVGVRPRWVDWLPYLGGLLAVAGFVTMVGLIVWLFVTGTRQTGVEDTAQGLHGFFKLLKPWMRGMMGAFSMLAIGLILIWAASADRRTPS